MCWCSDPLVFSSRVVEDCNTSTEYTWIGPLPSWNSLFDLKLTPLNYHNTKCTQAEGIKCKVAIPSNFGSLALTTPIHRTRPVHSICIVSWLHLVQLLYQTGRRAYMHLAKFKKILFQWLFPLQKDVARTSFFCPDDTHETHKHPRSRLVNMRQMISSSSVFHWVEGI